MISIPVAVNTSIFKMQLDLFWFNHKRIYGQDAINKAMAIIVNRNNKWDAPNRTPLCATEIPYKMCQSYHKYIDIHIEHSYFKPLNIQY